MLSIVPQNSVEENDVNLCIIDMQLMDSVNQSIVMLAVASNSPVSQLHYALGN